MDSLENVIAAIKQSPQSVLLAVDFDGTLAPIVADPRLAFAEPAAIDALARLGSHLGAIAIVTGRPVDTVLSLGRLEGRRGLENLTILGQYGAERWDASGQRQDVPSPENLPSLEAALAATLAHLGFSDAHVEHKGRALVVHTRQLPNPDEAFSILAEPLQALAMAHNLVAEPGRYVWELRDGAINKGIAMRALMAQFDPEIVIFAGDDLGDLPAFDAVEEHRIQGRLGLLVCSASTEQDALVERSDVVVDGPLGIAMWLTELAEDIGV